MDRTDQQWTIIEPLLEEKRRPDGRGRLWGNVVLFFARQIVLGELNGPSIEKIAIHTVPETWLRPDVNFRLLLEPVSNLFRFHSHGRPLPFGRAPVYCVRADFLEQVIARARP